MTKDAIVALLTLIKKAWDSRSSPLIAYVLLRKAAKQCEHLAELLQNRANVCYLDRCKQVGSEPYVIEGCLIKRYTLPEVWDYPEAIAAIDSKIDALAKRRDNLKAIYRDNGEAKKRKPEECKTVFTEDASRA